MKVRPGKYKIPHIGFTVKVKVVRSKILLGSTRIQAYVTFTNGSGVTITCRPNASVFVIAHELVHVLQHICRSRFLNFDTETEHTAYIMQYLLAEIFGYSYVTQDE